MAGSCAQPPTTTSVAIPPIPPQQTRVWFYRDVDPADNPTTPYVRLNGAIAGVPEQGGAFYRDVPPGHYQITVDSEGMSPSPSRDVVFAAGEQIYARIELGASWNGEGIYHRGRAERARPHRDRAQQSLRRQSGPAITIAAVRLLTLEAAGRSEAVSPEDLEL